MRTRIIQFIPVIFTLTIFGFRSFGLWRADLLYLFLFFFPPVAIVLIFVPRAIFNSWSIFATAMIVITLWIILVTPASQGGFHVISSTSREEVAHAFGAVFSIVSTILIILKLCFSNLREFYKKKYSPEDVHTQIKEQSILWAAGIGFISWLLCLYINFKNPFDDTSFLVFLLLILTSFTVSSYSLVRILPIFYNNLLRGHLALEWKIILSLCILALSTVTIITSIIIL